MPDFVSYIAHRCYYYTTCMALVYYLIHRCHYYNLVCYHTHRCHYCGFSLLPHPHITILAQFITSPQISPLWFQLATSTTGVTPATSFYFSDRCHNCDFISYPAHRCHQYDLSLIPHPQMSLVWFQFISPTHVIIISVCCITHRYYYCGFSLLPHPYIYVITVIYFIISSADVTIANLACDRKHRCHYWHFSLLPHPQMSNRDISLLPHPLMSLQWFQLNTSPKDATTIGVFLLLFF